MSEMEQLKADLQALQRTHELLPVNGDIVKATLRTLTDMIQAKIKELEAPPDPFEGEKRVVQDLREKEPRSWHFLGKYAIHLEDEVERLKAELANRPVVWCLKSKYNDKRLTDWNGRTLLFENAAQASRKRRDYHDYEVAIYTGKESE